MRQKIVAAGLVQLPGIGGGLGEHPPEGIARLVDALRHAGLPE